MRRPFAFAVVAATVSVLALTACGPGFEQGPAGTVVAKDKDLSCTYSGVGKKRHQSCSWKYELTVRIKDGSEHEFRVDGGV